MNTPLPRDPSNRFALDLTKINHVLILQNDDGKNIYAIASCGEKNDDLYFEECTAELNQLLNGKKDCEHVLSTITEKINSGSNSEAKLANIKNLLR